MIGRLRRSLGLCDEALAGLTDESSLEPTGPYHRGSHAVAMLGHTWTVYGKLAVMTRLNGIAPTAPRTRSSGYGRKAYPILSGTSTNA